MKKVSAAIAAVVVSGAVLTTTAIAMTPAYAQDRQSIATRAATAQAAAGSWEFTGTLYATKYECVDAGQQYEREGFPYKCTYAYFVGTNQDMYWLYIYN